MLDLSNYTHILIIILMCFLFCFFITFYIKKIAKHIGAMDIPDKRKVHKTPMPRLGGLGIFLTFLFGYMLFGVQSLQMNSILIGAFIIVIVGVIDDIRPLGAKTKLIGQIIAASVVLFYGGIALDKITIAGLHIDFGIFSYPLTILFIVGCINIINLIDGLDGLSTGTCSIFYFTIGIIAFIKASFGGLDVSLSFIMLGASLGFLCHNFHPAKIFSGDSGSMFQGFMIATISLLGFKTITMTSFFIPILLLGIPILDTLFAIIRRTIKKEPISKPDKLHLHHQLLNLGLSHRNTVLAIYAMNILFAFASIIYALNDKTLGMIIYIIILILIVFIITKTSIIADKNEKKGKNK
ncbi:MAG: glycosyltransferase family 4 protein [Bacilli bacterium]